MVAERIPDRLKEDLCDVLEEDTSPSTNFVPTLLLRDARYSHGVCEDEAMCCRSNRCCRLQTEAVAQDSPSLLPECVKTDPKLFSGWRRRTGCHSAFLFAIVTAYLISDAVGMRSSLGTLSASSPFDPTALKPNPLAHANSKPARRAKSML
eukprot:8579-Rhodomonas_salina.1